MIRIENLHKSKVGPSTDGTETVYVQKELFPEDEVKAEQDKVDEAGDTLKNLLTQFSLTNLAKLGNQDTSGIEEELSTITDKYLSFVASRLGVNPELLIQLAPKRIVSSEVTLNDKNGEAKQVRPDTVACYITSINSTVFNSEMISLLKNYSNGELCTHEHEHFARALQRTVVNAIDPQAIRLAVKDYFVDRLINEDVTDTSYIPTLGLRRQLGDFFAGIVDSLGNPEDKRIGKDEDGDSSLSQAGREELRNCLKRHRDYQALLELYNSEEEALKSVETMIDNIITGYEVVTGTFSSKAFRFRLLIPSEVIDQDKLGALVEEVSSSGNLELVKQEAIQSAKEFADCILGNIMVQAKLRFGQIPNKEDASRYFFSLEETQCYVAQTRWALENENLTPDEREKMECRIQLFTEGQELVELRKRASVAEQNPIIIRALNRYKSAKSSLKEVKESIDAQFEQITECQQVKDCADLTNLIAKEKELEIAKLAKKAKHDELRMAFSADEQKELPFWQSTQHLII